MQLYIRGYLYQTTTWCIFLSFGITYNRLFSIFSIFVHFYPNDDNLSQNVVVMVLIRFIFCGVLFNTTTHHLTDQSSILSKCFFPFQLTTFSFFFFPSQMEPFRECALPLNYNPINSS
jgi:hypothetical protein